MSRIDSVTFAYYLLQQARECGVEMNATKLQKLLYAVNGVLLAKGIDVIDEQCIATAFGPVYPKVYEKINLHNIRSYAQGLDVKQVTTNDKYDKIRETVQDVLNSLGEFSAARLSAWSHIEGSPGSQTVIDKDISKDSMIEYFSRAIADG